MLKKTEPILELYKQRSTSQPRLARIFENFDIAFFFLQLMTIVMTLMMM